VQLYALCVAIQLVDVIVLVHLRWVHPFFLAHQRFFLNCVTPVALDVVNHVFDLFTAWLNEMLIYAKLHPVQNWLSPTPDRV
jgi:hypothetical protein